jgi:transposase
LEVEKMPPPKHVEIERPETPPNIRTKIDEVWDKMNQGEQFFYTLQATVKGMDKRLDSLGKDVRGLSDRITENESASAARSNAHAASDLALRGEVGALRTSTDERLNALDQRLDRMEQTLQVLVDRQPQTPPVEAAPPPGPITSALGLAPRHPARAGSNAAVAVGGFSLAGALTLLGQVASLPVELRWALGVVAVMVALTACVVVGVRMVRRD